MKVSLASVPFIEACNLWLETRKPYLAPRTFKGYQDHVKTLSGFFGEMRLTEIDADQIRAYQKARMLRAGASIINHEVSTLQQMLKRIGRWSQIAPDYQPLSLPREQAGKCLTDTEEERYLRVAASNPAWEVAFWANLLMLRTGMGPGELRNLRLKDIDLEHKGIRVTMGTKNVHRQRYIPCTAEAWLAVSNFLERGKKLGCNEPEHYLIPYRMKRNAYDPTRPCQGWRTADREIKAAAGVRFVPYDCRRTVCTRMLENPQVNIETAQKVMGHISAKMIRQVYNHTRHETMLKALENLDRKPVQSISQFSKPKKTKQI